MRVSDGLPGAAKAYITALVLGAISLSAVYAANPQMGRPHPSADTAEILAAFAALFAAALLAESYHVRLPNTRVFDSNGDRITVSTVIYITSLLVYGPAFTMLITGGSIFIMELWRRKPFPKIAFNVSQYVLTVGISGLFLLTTGANSHAFALFGSPWSIAWLLGALIAYYVVNTGLVSGILALVTGASLKEVWLQDYGKILVQYVSMLNVGVMAGVLWVTSPLAVVLLALPMMLLQVAFRLVTQLKDETLKALIGIAEMVDARDSYAYRHSMDVARISNQIATKLSLPLEQIDIINLAGMLHDIGKIGTPDRVLHKPAALDKDERTVMELHPTEGAKVLQYFSLFRAGADLVLYHQEHYDGSGYPKGLSGRQIPIGARIIHVADAYQAMTSDRVYRKALPVEEAMRRLAADAGKQFDPEIVDALFEVLADQGAIKSREVLAPIRIDEKGESTVRNNGSGPGGAQQRVAELSSPITSEAAGPPALQTN